MSVAILLAAVAETVIVKRPAGVIARHFQIEPESLQNALLEMSAFSYRGQLEAALENPSNRPDLIPTRIHLARLEEHYAILMRHFDRAEAHCIEIVRRQDGYDARELQKAELASNRIHQQIQRNLKEMRKAELELKKSLATEDRQSAKPTPATANQVPAAIEQSSISNPEISAAANNSQPEPTLSASGGRESPEIPQSTSIPQIALTDSSNQPPMPEGFKNIILKYRHRIKHTKAEDRPALIAQLIERDRAKNAPNTGQAKPNLPTPSQNGKHAA